MKTLHHVRDEYYFLIQMTINIRRGFFFGIIKTRVVKENNIATGISFWPQIGWTICVRKFIFPLCPTGTCFRWWTDCILHSIDFVSFVVDNNHICAMWAPCSSFSAYNIQHSYVSWWLFESVASKTSFLMWFDIRECSWGIQVGMFKFFIFLLVF